MSHNEWEKSKLGDVVDTISIKHKFDKEKIILVNTSDVLDGKVLNHSYVENVNLRGQFKKSFQKGDILYSEIRPQNRRFAFVDFDSNDYVASTKLMVLRKKSDNIISSFLFQVLKSDEIIRNLQMIAETRSGTFPQITYNELANLEILLPSVTEQKAIADTLSCLDDKIELNNRINKTLEEMVQAIFESWFVDFEPFQDGEFEDSELGRIPKGWRVDSIGNCTSLVTRGIAPKYTDVSEQHVINQKCIRGGSLNIALSRPHCSLVKKEKILQFGDILINSTGVGTLGRVAQVYEDLKDYTVDSHVTIVRPNMSNKISYMGCLLRNMQIKFEHAGTGSTGQTELGRDAIQQMQIIVPSDSIMEAFSQIYDSIYERIVCSQKESVLLSTIRDSLLPKLMSGEIRVPLEEV